MACCLFDDTVADTRAQIPRIRTRRRPTVRHVTWASWFVVDLLLCVCIPHKAWRRFRIHLLRRSKAHEKFGRPATVVDLISDNTKTFPTKGFSVGAGE